MYQDIENLIEKNFDSIQPDLFSAIQEAPIPVIDSEEELFSELSHRKHRPLHWMAYVSVAALLLVMTTFFHLGRSITVGMIVVEASSSITLEVDQHDKIVSIETENQEDAKTYEKYQGKDLSHGLENIFSDIASDAEQTDSAPQEIKVTYHTVKKSDGPKAKLSKVVDSLSNHETIIVDAQYQSCQKTNVIELPPVDTVANENSDTVVDSKPVLNEKTEAESSNVTSVNDCIQEGTNVETTKTESMEVTESSTEEVIESNIETIPETNTSETTTEEISGSQTDPADSSIEMTGMDIAGEEKMPETLESSDSDVNGTTSVLFVEEME